MSVMLKLLHTYIPLLYKKCEITKMHIGMNCVSIGIEKNHIPRRQNFRGNANVGYNDDYVRTEDEEMIIISINENVNKFSIKGKKMLR